MLEQDEYKNASQEDIQQTRSDIEEQYLQKIQRDMDLQNQSYFENKARNLLVNAEKDQFCKAAYTLLLDNCKFIDSKKIENELN